MSRSAKILTWVASVLVVLLVVGFLTVRWTIHRSFPQTTGTIDVAGLEHPVTVLRDGAGIPQVYAETSGDLFFAQGYTQAQDRFFEMDFRRHLTAGTLSAMFGRSGLETDMFVRTLGWRRVAEQELPLLAPETRTYLQSYADGVNAYLADHSGARLSLEYAALRLDGLEYTPATWTPVDSLSWLKAMAWNLGSNIQDEIDRSLESTRLTESQIAALYPPYPYATNLPIVNQGAVVDEVYEQDATHGGTRLPPRPAFPDRAFGPALASAGDASSSLSDLLGTGDGIGSNAWAVSGDHTASGMPMLANDPHLDASMPGIWYEMGLHCRPLTAACPFDVSGFTFAGLPGVVIGHNRTVAWGFTNLYPDTQDLYLEKVDGDRYLFNGSWLPLQTRRESFEIRGESPETITVRTTRAGPIVSDVDDDLAAVGRVAPVAGAAPNRGVGYEVALRWTALEPGNTADALFGIDLARTWAQFREAARDFDSPSQNLVYADVHGHIGYQAPGLVPIRRTGRGDWPVPGWDSAYEWASTPVPFDALPSVLDPKDGYVVTANQAIVGRRYPYYIGDSFDYGFRAQRIRDLLEARPKLTVADMARIQLDTFSSLARSLTPVLQAVKLPTPYYRLAKATLDDWDFRQSATSPAAAYFNVVWKNLLALTFHDQVPKVAWPTGNSRWWVVVQNLLERPRDAFWDDVRTRDRETRDDILRAALKDARDELTQIRSSVPKQWRWGDLHRLTLRNATLGSSDSPVAFLFNRGPYEVPGGSSVVDAASFDASEGYQVTSVPSMRMIVPLDDLDAARWIDLTGESGHAYHGNYTDQTSLWLEGKTLPWPFSPAAVTASTV
ncbi:MAG: penicillin acylase family protein, partial [Nocardioidaceae bacterium]